MAEYVMMTSSALQLAGGVRSGIMAQKGAEASAQQLEWKQAAANLQAGQLDQQAAALEREAAATSTEADILAQRGADESKINREKLRREISAMYAKGAASGVSVDTGSPLMVVKDAAGWGAMQAALVEQENDIQVWEKRRQAMGIRDKSVITLDQAKLLRAEEPLYGWQASIARIGGDEALYGNILKGVTGSILITSPMWLKGSGYDGNALKIF